MIPFNLYGSRVQSPKEKKTLRKKKEVFFGLTLNKSQFPLWKMSHSPPSPPKKKIPSPLSEAPAQSPAGEPVRMAGLRGSKYFLSPIPIGDTRPEGAEGNTAAGSLVASKPKGSKKRKKEKKKRGKKEKNKLERERQEDGDLSHWPFWLRLGFASAPEDAGICHVDAHYQWCHAHHAAPQWHAAADSHDAVVELLSPSSPANSGRFVEIRDTDRLPDPEKRITKTSSRALKEERSGERALIRHALHTTRTHALQLPACHSWAVNGEAQATSWANPKKGD